MGKYGYAPQTARLTPPLVLGTCMALTAGLSSNVHMRHDNIYSMVACTAGVVLLSNLSYAALTTGQCVCHAVRAAVVGVTRERDAGTGTVKQQRPFADARPTPESGRAEDLSATVLGGITATVLLTQTIDFARARAEIKLYVSREEVWRMLYPLAGAFYVLFVCLPVYDATCTVCLSFGFFLQSANDELRRGLYFRRPTTRRIVFCMMGIAGMLAHCLAFAFVYIAGVRATSEGWHAGRGFVDELEEFHALLYNMSTEYLRTRGANISDAAAGGVANTSVWSARLNASTDIMSEDLTPNSANYKFADANVAQYLTWSAHAYPQSMCMLWFVCLLGASLLRNVPPSVRLPVAIEIAQPAVSAIAALVLCAASWCLDVPVFSLVDSQNALGDVYLLTSGGSVWLCILMLAQGVRDRCSVYVACVLLAIVMGKTVVQHAPLLQNHQAYELMICTWVALALYTTAAVVFCRKENVAVRAGWGGSGPIDSDDIDAHSPMDSDDEIEMAISCAQPVGIEVYSIEDVLVTAHEGIESSERVIAANPVPSSAHTNTHTSTKSKKKARAAANASNAEKTDACSDGGSENGSGKTVIDRTL